MNTTGKDVLDEILANRKVIAFMKLYYINRKLENKLWIQRKVEILEILQLIWKIN